MDRLRILRDIRTKISKKDEKYIAAHYRAELTRIEKERGCGVQGRVEFKEW